MLIWTSHFNIYQITSNTPHHATNIAKVARPHLPHCLSFEPLPPNDPSPTTLPNPHSSSTPRATYPIRPFHHSQCLPPAIPHSPFAAYLRLYFPPPPLPAHAVGHWCLRGPNLRPCNCGISSTLSERRVGRASLLFVYKHAHGLSRAALRFPAIQ
ncbi:hypothetical protein MRB53_039459 [Persea americana]|nr:hypothetical protein MRB53_039459 [Persea americana]